jgi:phosphoenolpyruvate-protein kinase (PTS system EI component)
VISFFYGVPPFFCTVVCIACSQFEKLRVMLLAIGQDKETPERDLAADCNQTEGNGQIYICQEMFSLMQEQLKECVSLHRLILE